MKRTALVGAIVAGVLLATAIPAGAHHKGGKGWKKERPTIAAIVAQSGGGFDNNSHDYDLLLNAVQAAGLVDALNNPGDKLTVWAPNDRAFIRLANDLGYAGHDEEGAFNTIVGALTSLGGGDPIPLLTAVLTYHVTPGVYDVWRVLWTKEFPTLQGGTIERKGLKLIDKEPALKDPRLTWPLNVRASNGVIHTIDRVLIPAPVISG
jgi:serralysin